MINFITSNAKKASDFKTFGFGVKEFPIETPEIKDENVETVALHKARDTNLNGIVVEDTALYVEGSHFFGTDIKHVYEEISNNETYEGHKAVWKICLCMKKNGNYYLSIGELEGILKYPKTEEGYHFEKILAVKINNEYLHYSQLSIKKQQQLSPRFKALHKLSFALKNNNFNSLIQFKEEEILNWQGEYQVENQYTKPKI